MAALTSDRMRGSEYAGDYDWVLLDAPPVGIMPDGPVGRHDGSDAVRHRRRVDALPCGWRALRSWA